MRNGYDLNSVNGQIKNTDMWPITTRWWEVWDHISEMDKGFESIDFDV